MYDDFKKFISENFLIKPGERVLLAISGGIDSMVMAHLFLKLGIETGIAHCNFSLRAEESDNDEKLVQQFSENHNIPFFTTRFDTKSIARKRKISVQMAARELRYEWFEEIREKFNFDSIAVAHNLNDNIETLIINLIRGTGLTGLSGMKSKNKRIIRPILFATRHSIEDYCKKEGINFREDRSNTDTKYTRNKIRHLVLPVLREINPSIETTLNETAGRFSDLNNIISEYISSLRNNITERKGMLIYLNISILKPHLHNKSILFELFKPYGITNVQLNDLLKVINGRTGARIFTESHRIIKNRKDLIISQEEVKNEPAFIVNNLTQLKKAPGIESAEYLKISAEFQIPDDSSIACINAEKIIFPLIIRKWKPGDHFYPLGMKQKKKLSDYFIDRKLSIFDKENSFILESDGKIVWIVGDRLDNRFRITPSTEKILMINSYRKSPDIKSLK
jgi:tRNA(Ile)-lysidine synthase